MVADDIDAVASRQVASASLRAFMRLAETQRACVILSGVLGALIARGLRHPPFQPACREGVPASRPRQAWRFALEQDALQPRLSDAERAAQRHVAHFNGRDFDAVRATLADDIRLDLVNRTRMRRSPRVRQCRPQNRHYNS
ncbi:MAG: hypothetical protein ACRC1G_04615 [Bradyrhizobium sp.]